MKGDTILMEREGNMEEEGERERKRGRRERERVEGGREIVQGRWRVKYLLISELYGSFLNVFIHNFDS